MPNRSNTYSHSSYSTVSTKPVRLMCKIIQGVTTQLSVSRSSESILEIQHCPFFTDEHIGESLGNQYNLAVHYSQQGRFIN